MLTQYDEGIMSNTARAPGFSDGAATEEIPVFRPLASMMKVDLVMNPDSKVWILHDKPFPDILMWAEYDIDSASLTLVYRNGKIQELGLKIHAPMRKYLRSARQLFTMRLEGDQIVDTYVRPLLVRETGYYKA
jgi:hypothetical protein